MELSPESIAKLLGFQNAEISFEYDASGNITKITVCSGSYCKTVLFTYDAEGNIIKIEVIRC